ncbi:unnamed protein product, partial [Symbiodinium sp. KB8]
MNGLCLFFGTDRASSDSCVMLTVEAFGEMPDTSQGLLERQMNRLGEVRLLQLRHAKVSVVDFSCRTPSASSTAPAPAQADRPLSPRERERDQAAMGGSVQQRSGESLDTRTTATILAKNRELQRVSSALAAKAHEAEIYKQELAMARQAHGADETLRTHLVDELLSWASHLEARAEEFFSTELKTAAALTKEEARASHEALRQSLALELKEEMVAASCGYRHRNMQGCEVYGSDAIQERAQLRVFAARKEMALQMRVQSTEQAMEEAAQQEILEAGEQQLATARAKLDEENEAFAQRSFVGEGRREPAFALGSSAATDTG